MAGANTGRWESTNNKIKELAVRSIPAANIGLRASVAAKSEQVTKKVETAISVIANNQDSDLSSDSDDHLGSGSNLSIEDVIDDLKTDIQCLIDLGPRYLDPARGRRRASLGKEQQSQELKLDRATTEEKSAMSTPLIGDTGKSDAISTPAVTSEFGGLVKPSFRTVLGDFILTLRSPERDYMAGKRLIAVQQIITGIQEKQARIKGLINFTRARDFLERLAELDVLCRLVEASPDLLDKLSSFLWGPCHYIFLVRPLLTSLSHSWQF